MDFFDLVNIAERDMELVNPSSPEKIITLGRRLRLRAEERVIDFGCGFAEPLVLWAESFGIAGVGIDIRPYACERARRKIAARGLADRLTIECADGSAVEFEPAGYDVAACLGASFIWGGFRPALQAMRRAIGPGGRLAIGEPFWLSDGPPAVHPADGPAFHTEAELLQIIRDEGFELEGIVRASHDDWDRYESDNWAGLLRWLRENPDHPDRETVRRHLHQTQDDYARVNREHLGWAMFALAALPDR